MKLKLTVFAVAALLICAGFVMSCGPQGKYADVRALASELISVVNNLDSALDSGDAKKVAASLNDFTAKMKELGPKMEALPEKYPELKGDKVPPELESLEKEMNQAEAKMNGIFTKLQKYSKDPDVMKAMQAFQGTM